MSNELSVEQLEWLGEIVWQYRDDRDWTQNEWAELQDIMDKLDGQIEERP